MKKKRQIERGRQIYKQIAKRKDIDIHNKKEKIKAKLPRERYRQRKVIHKSYKEKEECNRPDEIKPRDKQRKKGREQSTVKNTSRNTNLRISIFNQLFV